MSYMEFKKHFNRNCGVWIFSGNFFVGVTLKFYSVKYLERVYNCKFELGIDFDVHILWSG